MIKLLLLLLALMAGSVQTAGENVVHLPLALCDVHSGMATITGRLVTDYESLPIRLAEVYRQGELAVFVLDLAWSPGVDSEEDGYFIFEEVEPIEYGIVIGNPFGKYQIIADGDKAFTFIPIKGGIYDVGDLVIKLKGD